MELIRAGARAGFTFVLAVGHMSRLFRDAAMWHLFVKEDVQFLLADLPHIDGTSSIGKLILGILAQIAQCPRGGLGRGDPYVARRCPRSRLLSLVRRAG